MKVTLEFDLTDEEQAYEYQACKYASEMRRAIHEHDQVLRRVSKYGDMTLFPGRSSWKFKLFSFFFPVLSKKIVETYGWARVEYATAWRENLWECLTDSGVPDEVIY